MTETSTKKVKPIINFDCPEVVCEGVVHIFDKDGNLKSELKLTSVETREQQEETQDGT